MLVVTLGRDSVGFLLISLCVTGNEPGDLGLPFFHALRGGAGAGPPQVPVRA